MSTIAIPKRPYISEQTTETNINRQWFQAVLERWKIADEFVRFFDQELIPADHALRKLVEKDFPQLVGELARFRPDLFRDAK